MQDKKNFYINGEWVSPIESRILQVNVVYSLGKKEVKSERKRNTGSEDILERVKE